MLAELSLDTLTYADLADRGRRRIPSLSRSLWTDHNAHDPGITLIELYAWLLEQRGYWLDQVTPPIERALLRLLGAAPLRARAARTVLEATAASDGPAGHLVLDAKDQAIVAAGADGGRLAFTLDESIAVLRTTDVGVVTSVSGKSRSTDLRRGRSVVLFPNDGKPAWVRLDFKLQSPWRPTGKPISILFDLRMPDHVPPEPEILPQWHPESVHVPPAADLLVHASTPGEKWTSVKVHDGTAGFRRSGIIQIDPPDDWSPDPDGTWRILISTSAATFSVPPRLAQLRVNAVHASHRAFGHYSERDRWPPLPGRSIQVPLSYDHGVLLTHDDRSPPAGPKAMLVLEILEKGHWVQWAPVDDLTRFGPDARVFTVEGSIVRFGNGINGRQPVSPPSAASASPESGWLRLDYYEGGGTVGNVGAGTRFTLDETNPAGKLALVSVVQALGGRDDESLPEARLRAAGWQTEVTRAVLAGDYETLARTTPGVAIRRAIPVVGFRENHPVKAPGAVTVFVLPFAPRGDEGDVVEAVDVPAPFPDPGALKAVRDHLGAARLVGSEVVVRPPLYRDVKVRFEATTRLTSTSNLLADIRRAILEYLDPLVGGGERMGWPLGGDIEPSALVRVAQQAAGDDTRIESVSIGVGCEPREPACAPVAIGFCYLPRLVDVALHTAPIFDAGGLK